MALGTAHRGQTTTNIDSFTPTLYTSELLENEKANLVAGLLFWNLDWMYDGSTKTYKLPKGGTHTVSAKTRGTAVDYNDPADSEVNLTLDKNYYDAWLYEDDVPATTLPALLSSDMAEGGYAIAKQFDTDILGQYASLTLTTEAATTDTGTNLRNHWISAMQKLDAADIPASDRIAIVSPLMKSRLLQVTEFISGDYIKGQPIENGLLGELLGVKVYVSTNVPSATVSSVTTYYNFFGHRSAYAHMTAFTNFSRDRVPTQLGYQYAINKLYGVAVPYPGRGLQFTCTSA